MAKTRNGRFTVRMCVLLSATLAAAACGTTDGAKWVDAGDGGGLDAVLCDTDQSDDFGCESIGSTEEEQVFGCCMGDHLYYCDDGDLLDGDCVSEGLGTCGVNDQDGYMDCV